MEGFFLLIPFFIFALWASIIILSLVATAFWIWMIIDLLQKSPKDFKGKDDKVIWIIIVIFTQFIGALLYFFLIKNKKN